MNQKQIDDFVAYLDYQDTELTSFNNFVGVSVHDDEAVLEYKLPRRHRAEELLDEIDDLPELVLSYHVRSNDDAALRGDRICGYSDPHVDYVYKLNAVCDADGRCDTLYLTLYDSLETLGIVMLDEFRRQTSENRVLYRRSEQQMLSDFLN